MGRILVITHGKPESRKANPALSLEGKDNLKNVHRELEKLWDQFGKIPKLILSGTGALHAQTAKALNLKITQYSPILGCGDLKLGNDILLVSGEMVPSISYFNIEESVHFIKPWLESLLEDPSDKVIILDPCLMESLGIKFQARFGDVYRFKRNETERMVIGIN